MGRQVLVTFGQSSKSHRGFPLIDLKQDRTYRHTVKYDRGNLTYMKQRELNIKEQALSNISLTQKNIEVIIQPKKERRETVPFELPKA